MLMGKVRILLGPGGPRCRLMVVCTFIQIVLCTGVIRANSIPGESAVWVPPPIDRAPLFIGGEVVVTPLVTLASAQEAETQKYRDLVEYNRKGLLPTQNGFTRSFDVVEVILDGGVEASATAAPFSGGLLMTRGGMLVWSASIEVAHAFALRVHLQEVELPAGAAIFVGDGSGWTEGPFGEEIVGPEGDMWLPAAWGSKVLVEVQVDPASMREGEKLVFSIGEIAEIVDITGETEVWTDCDLDATCVSPASLSVVEDYRNAVAHLWFMVGGSGYICTGGLVNDTVGGTWIPYLLTANHCFSTQSSATSLNAYFDYRSSTCNGSIPPLGSVPVVAGSTLLATDPSSDFTFVQLNSSPSGTNYFLGWTVATPANGTLLHRISHPAGTAQKYSIGSFMASGGIQCNGFPRPDFHYSAPVLGSTTGGSSGGPVIIDAQGGQIVGQLYGTCHYTPWDDCDYPTYNWMDGGFGTTYNSISQWVDPALTDLIFMDGFESGDTSAW